MGELIVKHGDLLKVNVTPPTVVPGLVAPIPLIGSSTKVHVAGCPACLLGDELPKVLQAPIAYTAPPFVTPGMGKLTLVLEPDNQTKTTTNGKPILLKGAQFVATFTVESPAMQPTPAGPVPDPLLVKEWTASFVTTTTNVSAG